ncbi:MAG: hypothetical protein MJZ17_05665 [Bacteroidales bacterium]|nr:hypothetical protein [Bacteroidales bacterium]
MPRIKKDATKETAKPAAAGEVHAVTGKRLACGTGGPLAAIKNSRKKFDEASQMRRDLLSKLGMGSGLKAASAVNRPYIPYPWMALQYLTGNIGLPVQTITEVIGSDKLGKSSLIMAMLAAFTRAGCYCLYMSTESKTPKDRWVRERLSGTDPETAKDIADAIDVEENQYTYGDIDKFMRNWVKIRRVDEMIPKSEPIVVVIDSISSPLTGEGDKALVDDAAKEGGLQLGVDDVKEKMCAAASWLHNWVRHLKPWLEKNNVTLICVSSQNQDTSIYKVADKNNRVKRGGEALNQKSALQLILAKTSGKQASLVDGAKNVILKCYKNSYGAEQREMVYTLKQEAYKYGDTDTYTEQAIDMSTTLCNILMDNHLLGLTCNRKKYSSEELGLYQVSAEEVENKINSDEALQCKVGSLLKIDGYEYEEEKRPEAERGDDDQVAGEGTEG